MREMCMSPEMIETCHDLTEEEWEMNVAKQQTITTLPFLNLKK